MLLLALELDTDVVEALVVVADCVELVELLELELTELLVLELAVLLELLDAVLLLDEDTLCVLLELDCSSHVKRQNSPSRSANAPTAISTSRV